VPDVGLVNPQSMRIVVVFPAPFEPKNPKISPRRTDIDILLVAIFLPNFFDRSLRTISDSTMEILKRIPLV
jgi:hypothetical protein